MNNKPKLDFNDILIVPEKQTQIYSRYKGVYLGDSLPLFTAPMDTVVNEKNYKTFIKNGFKVVLPRTINNSGLILSEKNNENLFFSLGLNELNKGNIEDTLEKLPKHTQILIDIANGHMDIVIKIAKDIKQKRPDITLMVGNIANPDTYYEMAKSQVMDYIRIGIGNGSGCLTTKQSGVGFPMASLIYEIKQKKDLFIKNNPTKKAPYIIADGGMKDYADIIKALALGADYVMLGSILNKSLESCASNYLFRIKLNNRIAKRFFMWGLPIKKYFRGMSTKEAQKAMGKTNLKTSEGVVRFRKVEYALSGWVENFSHYLRNAMSYSNKKTIKDFIGNVKTIQITNNAYERFNK